MDTATFWFQNGTADGPNPNLIGNSLRFRGTQRLERTPTTAGNRKTFTVSFWVKFGQKTSTNQSEYMFQAGTGPTSSWTHYQENYSVADRTGAFYMGQGGTSADAWTSGAQFRDYGAWLHYCSVQDYTATDKWRLYINGRLVPDVQSSYPLIDQNSEWNNSVIHYIGNHTYASPYGFMGYMAEFHSVDGQALGPETFGEYDANGVWVPKIVGDIDYGTNGFYLDFSDPNNIGADRRGSGEGFGNWYGSVSGSNDSGSWLGVLDGTANVFDTASFIYCVNQTSTLTFATPLSGEIEVYGSEGSNTTGGGGTQARLSDGSAVSFDGVSRQNPQWKSFGTKSNITSIDCIGGSVHGFILGGIRVNGEILWQANNWTPTGFELTDTTSEYYDWVSDSPTDNYSLYNPLHRINDRAGDLRTANYQHKLHTDGTTKRNFPKYYQSIALPPSGRWYFECMNETGACGTFLSTTQWLEQLALGVTNPGFENQTDAWTCQCTDAGGNFRYNGGQKDLNKPFVAGTWMGVAIDMDNQTYRHWNGTFSNTGSFAGYPTDQNSYFSGSNNASTNASTFTINSGGSPYQFAVPDGYQSLSTAELPNVAIRNPSEHFQTILSGSDPRPNPPQIGDERAGGYFAGYKLSDDGTQVNELIVAPVSEGSLNGRRQGNFSNKATNTNIPNADNLNTGRFATSAYGDDSGWFAWHWCKNDTTGPNAGNYDTTNTAGTGIGGFNDWYIPAINEMQMIYRAFKPTTANNNTSWGAVGVAVPPTNNYTSTDPGQTSVALFQEGAAQALPTDAVFGTSSRYTDGSFTPGTWAIRWNNMADGNIFWNGGYTLTNSYQLAVRLGDGYPAEILEAAQLTFPNGLWWVKDRDNENQNQLVDSVRGGNLALRSPAKDGEQAYVAPAGNSVAWCWSAPETFTPTSPDGLTNLSGQRNLDTGFSIVTYSGSNANASFTHGLNQAPEFRIHAVRNGSGDFPTQHIGYPDANRYQYLTGSGGMGSNSNFWNGQFPDATHAFVGTNGRTNSSGNNYVAYMWHSVPGYSAFGSYQGNNNSDGPFIYTGFRVAWLMVRKLASSVDWKIYDSMRDTYNPASTRLEASQTRPELSGNAQEIDFLSNGFKFRGTNGDQNSSGTFIYAAFAEHPFGGSNVFPTTAR